MSTFVFYIDESGSTDTFSVPIENGRTPLFTLASVAIPLDQWRNVDRAYNSLKEKFFPDVLSRKGRKELIEVKGNDLIAPRNALSTRRHQFLKEVFHFLGSLDVRLFGVSFLKSTVNPTASISLYTKGFQILLERFNHYITTSETHDAGIMICDSRAGAIKGKGLDKEVASSFQSFIFGNALGRTLTRIHEAPMFADSQVTVGVQLADIVAACLYANHYRYYIDPVEGAMDYREPRKTCYFYIFRPWLVAETVVVA